MPAEDPPPRLDPAELADLRDHLPPLVHFGTSSWTYPGWQGLVYHQPYPARGAATRLLEEYVRFPLFTTVGIDSSFYAPPSPATLESYARHLPPDFRCVSKVWDCITVHTHSRLRDKARGGDANPHFLDATLFVESVLEPCRAHFAGHVGPFVFEFQALPPGAFTPEGFAARLDAFFSALPRDAPYAVELRNPEFLVPAYFAVLREHGVAHLFNSWTRMPPIGEQLDLPGCLTAEFIVARALLRPGRYYEEAVDAFAPYDRIRDEDPALRWDLVRLADLAVETRVPAYILVNNRAEGSAPHTIAAVARLIAGRSATGPGGPGPSGTPPP